jgi:hypothetical protein
MSGINRRSASLAVAGALLGAGAPVTAQVIKSDPSAIFDWAARLPFVETGSGPKACYVVFAPWCGACQFLVRQTQNVSGIRWRWIGVSPNNVQQRRFLAALYNGGDGSLVTDHFLRGASKGTDLSENDWTLTHSASSWLMQVVASSRSVRSAYPMLVAPTKKDGGMLAMTGSPENFDQFLGEVVDVPPTAAVRLRDIPMTLGSGPVRSGFATKDLMLRAAPFDDALPVQALEKSRGFDGWDRKATVDGVTWLGTTLLVAGQLKVPLYGWAKASEIKI